MPTDMLDSPLIPLGAVFLAGQRSRGIASRQDTGGESGVNLLVGGWAGESSGYATNEIMNAVGLSGTVSPLLGQALLGAGVSRAGFIPKNRPMARGIMYNVVGSGASELGFDLGSLMGGTFGGGETATRSTSSPQREASYSRRNNGLTF